MHTLRKRCKCGQPCRDTWCIECSNKRNTHRAGVKWRRDNGARPERGVGVSNYIPMYLEENKPQYWAHTATHLDETDYGCFSNNGKVKKASVME